MIEALTPPAAEISEARAAEEDAMNRLEAALMDGEQITCPLVHSFTPGIYIRQIFIPAGAMITSRVHKTEHHFIILKGVIVVKSGTEDVVYRAPYMGITDPGTRRALLAIEDTVWATIHANPDDITDPDVIVETITDAANNPLIDPDDPRANGWKTSNSPSVICISNKIPLLR